MIREAPPKETILDAVFVYRFSGPICEHNYFCAVCRDNKAVLDCNSGMLTPCWKCRSKGYRIVKLKRIDNDKGYSSKNCRWATMKEQASNRRSAQKEQK